MSCNKLCDPLAVCSNIKLNTFNRFIVKAMPDIRISDI